MLTISPSISFSYWSLVVCYINMISEITLKKLDFVMVAKSALKNIQVSSPIEIVAIISKNKKENTNEDSNIELYQWKLKKNLETLTFLAELESRYEKNNAISAIMEECYNLKKEVQQRTVQLTKKIAFYKEENI